MKEKKVLLKILLTLLCLLSIAVTVSSCSLDGKYSTGSTSDSSGLEKKQVVSIFTDNIPTTYTVGETINYSFYTVTATYSDGTAKEITLTSDMIT